MLELRTLLYDFFSLDVALRIAATERAVRCVRFCAILVGFWIAFGATLTPCCKVWIHTHISLVCVSVVNSLLSLVVIRRRTGPARAVRPQQLHKYLYVRASPGASADDYS